MLDHKLMKDLAMTDDDLNPLVASIFEKQGALDAMKKSEEMVRRFEIGSVVRGKVLSASKNEVLLDLGYKAEGVLSVDEFDDVSAVDAGDEIEVLLEGIDDESGMLLISKRKADKVRGWERLVTQYHEGDTIKGKAVRKIKGGLLVDVGVPVFLPASQVDLRRTIDIEELIGKEIACKILKIDTERRNVVVSRRRLLEEVRDQQKHKLFEELTVGQTRRGIVKNIADFGVFVDLGGTDGLLHITDMSWGRVGHPSELVKVNEELEVQILSIDREKERVALGTKQLKPDPWESVEQKYPPGIKVKGKVVNVVTYGAFVELEPGVEGLVHISEMSWTRRIATPNEVVAIGNEIEVVVLKIDREKRTISLGIKQTEVNPWDLVAQKFPKDRIVEGKVRNLTNYGAFIELEDGIDGLLHVSDMSWTKRVGHPQEMLKKDDVVKAIVLSVDREKKRVSLGLKQLVADPWIEEIPAKFTVGNVIPGKITKLANFGAFVEIAPQLDGLLHLTEMTDNPAAKPEQIVTVGQDLQVMIIKIDKENKRIGLSLKGVPQDSKQ